MSGDWLTMNNVIDFPGKKKAQDYNPGIKSTEIVCPCTSNTFTFFCLQSTGQFYLKCVSCNQTYDVTGMLAEMMHKEKAVSGENACTFISQGAAD